MALERVTSVRVRPDSIDAFQKQVGTLASEAISKEKEWRWTAHRTLFGEGMMFHFTARADSFSEIDAQGTTDDLWIRVLGESRGEKALAATNECILDVRQTLSIDRPDLSYMDELPDPRERPYAVVTVARARPGHAEGCEELIRKVAEAIPKVGDPARMMAYQAVLGDPSTYWTVRPLESLADLDDQLPANELLNRAFGNGEGGLLWRSGSEAIQEVRRSVVQYVPELSNPPQS